MRHIGICIALSVLSACVIDDDPLTEPSPPTRGTDGQVESDQGDAVLPRAPDIAMSDNRDATRTTRDSEMTQPVADAAVSDSNLADVQQTDMGGTSGTGSTSCGDTFDSPDGLVDCTQAGDTSAGCVYGNHCLCSEGFECTEQTQWPDSNECDPGAFCVPRSEPQRCGYTNNGQVAVDCGQLGDNNAQCEADLYCLCSDGFVCGQMQQPAPGDGCEPNVVCVPESAGPEGSRSDSCGSANQSLAPVNCGVFGDQSAFCVYGNHCVCSDGFVCERTQMSASCEPGRRCVPED